MTIYSRFGSEVTLERLAILEDIERLDGRKPDAHDRRRIQDECYIVVRRVADGRRILADVAYLRADGGLSEIESAILRHGRRADRPGGEQEATEEDIEDEV